MQVNKLIVFSLIFAFLRMPTDVAKKSRQKYIQYCVNLLSTGKLKARNIYLLVA
jgi:hypothetical protein